MLRPLQHLYQNARFAVQVPQHQYESSVARAQAFTNDFQTLLREMPMQSIQRLRPDLLQSLLLREITKKYLGTRIEAKMYKPSLQLILGVQAFDPDPLGKSVLEWDVTNDLPNSFSVGSFRPGVPTMHFLFTCGKVIGEERAEQCLDGVLAPLCRNPSQITVASKHGPTSYDFLHLFYGPQTKETYAVYGVNTKPTFR